MICPVTDRPCTTNGCGEKCYKKDSLGYSVNPLSGIKPNNMNEYDVKRLALVLAIQAEVEGMKAFNAQHFDQKYTMEDFQNKAEELRNIAYCHNEQL